MSQQSDQNGAPSKLNPSIAGLVLVHVVLTAISIRLLTAASIANYLWPRWQSIFVEALAVSQVGLVSTWLVMGRTSFPLRLSGHVILLGLWLVVLNFAGLGHEFWLGLLLTQAIGTSGSLFFCLRCLKVETYRGRSELPLPMSQGITLGRMFAWLTAICCGLAFMAVVQQLQTSTVVRANVQARAISLGVLFIPITLVVVWAALADHWRLLPLSIAAVTTVAVALGAGHVDQVFRRTRWSALSPKAYTTAYWYWVLLVSAVVLLSLFVVRLQGFMLSQGTDEKEVGTLPKRRFAPLWIGAGAVLLMLIGLGNLRGFIIAAAVIYSGWLIVRTGWGMSRGDRRNASVCGAALVLVIALILGRPHPTVHGILAMAFPVLFLVTGLGGLLMVAVVGLTLGNLFVLLAPWLDHQLSLFRARLFGWTLVACTLCTWSIPWIEPRLVLNGSYHYLVCLAQSISALAILVWARTDGEPRKQPKTEGAGESS